MEYTYPTFKKASRKHLEVCECLVNSLEMRECNSKEKHILITIYYLSGYIFETILKFSIYSAIEFDRNESIKKLNSSKREYNLSYNQGVKKRRLETHNLKELKNIFEEKHFERLDSEFLKKCEKLFYEWNSELRYEVNFIKFNKKDIITFFEFAKNTYKKLEKYK